MRRVLSTTLGLVGLILLGGLTFSVTSSVLAQRRVPRQAAFTAAGVGKTGSGTTVLGAAPGAHRPAFNPVSDRTVESYFQRGRFQVKTNGREVNIMADGWYMHDKRPNQSYLWMLEIRDLADDESTILKRRYDREKFALPAEGEARPSFAEHLELPPGYYQVRLGLYHLPAGVDSERLNDPDMASDHLGILAWENILVR